MNNLGTQIISLATLVLGAILGYLVQIGQGAIEKKRGIINKLFEQFLEARKEICKILSKLASLKSTSMTDSAELDKFRDSVSCLYFEHYDLLPITVLNELQCLFLCLSDKTGNLYAIDSEGDLKRIEQEGDVEEFLMGVSQISNFKYVAFAQLSSHDAAIRRSASINYQARRVLTEINKHFTLNYFMSIYKSLRK
jgi:hypothetical protein